MRDGVLKIWILITMGYGIINGLIYGLLYGFATMFNDTSQSQADLKQMVQILLIGINRYLVWLYVLALLLSLFGALLAYRAQKSRDGLN